MNITETFIQTFQAIREVYSSCCGTNLDPNHRIVTQNFNQSWPKLFEIPEINVSWTTKVHQISDHFSDYCKDPLVEGRTLGVTTDQIIEHMHSYINRLLTKSFYKLKDYKSEKTVEKQHAGIFKINSFSVKIKK